MKLSVTGQKKTTFWYRLLLNTGDRMGRFDCIYMSATIQ